MANISRNKSKIKLLPKNRKSKKSRKLTKSSKSRKPTRNVKKKKTGKNKPYCSPSLKPGSRHKTCFNKKGLTKIARAWNKKNSNNKIQFSENTSDEKLWENINTKLRSKCNKEYCWVKETFQSEKDDDPDLNVFKPIAPEKWFDNKNEWLNTLDIQNIMFQYEDKHPEFRFIGPVPIDFDAKSASGCIVNELCKLKISDLVRDNIRKLGVIFNLDKHNQSGSHWIAMFCNIDKREICFWDSYGSEPPKEVTVLMERLSQQSQESLNKKFKIKINDVRHQYQGSECGVYCLHFIIQLLEGRSFDNVTNNIIDDEKMWLNRKKYFIWDKTKGKKIKKESNYGLSNFL